MARSGSGAVRVRIETRLPLRLLQERRVKRQRCEYGKHDDDRNADPDDRRLPQKIEQRRTPRTACIERRPTAKLQELRGDPLHVAWLHGFVSRHFDAAATAREHLGDSFETIRPSLTPKESAHVNNSLSLSPSFNACRPGLS